MENRYKQNHHRRVNRIKKGMILPLENFSHPIMKRLLRNYKQDPTCTTGGIEFHFSFNRIGINDGENYWQNN